MSDILDRIAEFNKFGSKLGLERMEKLLEMLGNPEKNLRVIHIAGTNGKGSTCRFIYNVLIENGYKVGLFTSPFIENFTERIEANGEEISIEMLEELGSVVIDIANEYSEKSEDQPTEFEIVTVIALLYFERMGLDFVVLEVGLGGLGDSTNIIKEPLITAITSISYDHMDRLGNTLAEIAREKAGIIKKGAPIIINVNEEEAKKEIAKKAYSAGSTLYDLSKLKNRIEQADKNGTVFSTKIFDTNYDAVRVSLPGRHQVDNAVTALSCIEFLRKNGIIKVHRDAVYEGLNKTRNKGRLEIIEGDIPVVLDGAHNLAAFKKLKENVDYMFPNKKPILIMSILEGKANKDVLEAIADLGSKFFLVEMKYPGGMNPYSLKEELLKISSELSIEVCEADEVIESIRNTNTEKAYASENEYFLVTGSLYFIGEMLTKIKK